VHGDFRPYPKNLTPLTDTPEILGFVMKFARRKILHLAAGAVALPVVPRVARAQPYPTRPVRIIVGFPAGIAPDILARLLGQKLSERLGQSFIVENRPGAGTNIGTEAVVRAEPDGYTLLLFVPSSAFNQVLYENLNFNFIRDIAPVANVGDGPFFMVVTPSLPAQTVAEFITYAKAKPGKINMASPGNGTSPHLCGELFQMMTGINLVHVPYRGSYMPDLLGGQVQVAFSSITTAIDYVRTGKLRPLAVTSAKRWETLPDVPTVGETVPGYDVSTWFGIGVPKNTSGEIIEKLNKEINGVLADPDMKARLVDLGVVPMPMTPAEFGRFIGDETEKWARVIKIAQIKPD
jgi:tripartite-type tricarboxylate transporter receptor subunit TctC